MALLKRRSRGYLSLLSLALACILLAIPGTASAAPVVSSWGDSTYGELGNGTSGNNTATKVPVLVSGLGEDVKAISAGGSHALALLQDGTVMAWGNNGAGGLGDGTIVQRDAPVSVNGLSGVKAIAAGEGHSLALMNDGTVMAWGRNDVGQLGIGTASGPETCMSGLPCSTKPVQVKGLSGVKAISTSYDHSLALLSDGTVVAWGRNQWGELGIGTNGTKACGDGWLCNPTPTPVPGLSGGTEVVAGNNQSLALLGDGTVMAWGNNNDGILGVGTGSAATPMAVQGLSGVTAIASGWLHDLALLEDGTVMAWGYNSNGQLGDGTNVDRDHPVAVSGLSDVTALAAGAYSSMALLGDGTVRSWGWNILWSLGNLAAGDESRVPVPVDGLTGVTAIASGYMNGYALGGTPATYPKVSSISPHTGPEEGGTTVSITGTGLANVTSVKFGSADASSFTVNSDTSITAVSPPGTGFVAVTVADERGSSYASGSTYFRYGSEKAECMIPEGCGPGEPECFIEPWECRGGEFPEPPEEPGTVEPLIEEPASPEEEPQGNGPEAPPASGDGNASTSNVTTRSAPPAETSKQSGSASKRCKRKWTQAKGSQKKHRKALACASAR